MKKPESRTEGTIPGYRNKKVLTVEQYEANKLYKKNCRVFKKLEYYSKYVKVEEVEGYLFFICPHCENKHSLACADVDHVLNNGDKHKKYLKEKFGLNRNLGAEELLELIEKDDVESNSKFPVQVICANCHRIKTWDGGMKESVEEYQSKRTRKFQIISNTDEGTCTLDTNTPTTSS